VAPGGENPVDKLLDGKSGRKVVLTVNEKPERDGARAVALKPVSSGAGGNLRYQQWVNERRRLTEKLSNGRVAYLHVRSMNGSSERQFKEEFIGEAGEKQALIVDVRFNGGGNIAHNLLDILRKRPYVTFKPRSLAQQVPGDWFGDYMWARPAALLINEQSASNSEMMALGFKALDVGPVIGAPTMGAVIATGSWSLIDGGSMRMPSSGVFSANGEDLESAGRQPDQLVPYDPMAIAAGRDPQLEAAVRLVTAQLAEKSVGRQNLQALIRQVTAAAAAAPPPAAATTAQPPDPAAASPKPVGAARE